MAYHRINTHQLMPEFLLSSGTNFGMLTGSALATLISYIFLDISLLRNLISEGYLINKLYDLNTLFKLVIISLLMVGVIFALYPFLSYSIFSIFVLIGISGVFYLIVCYFWLKKSFNFFFNTTQ